MADYNEAIKNLQKIQGMPLTIRLAIEALEKRTKKMVTHEATLYKPHTCPACKNVVDEFTGFFGEKVLARAMFCKYCGQALDWGDE